MKRVGENQVSPLFISRVQVVQERALKMKRGVGQSIIGVATRMPPSGGAIFSLRNFKNKNSAFLFPHKNFFYFLKNKKSSNVLRRVDELCVSNDQVVLVVAWSFSRNNTGGGTRTYYKQSKHISRNYGMKCEPFSRRIPLPPLFFIIFILFPFLYVPNMQMSPEPPLEKMLCAFRVFYSLKATI